jgi:hypothetical protein
VRLCAGPPLAVRVTGGWLADRPGWWLGDLGARLADERERLVRLDRLASGEAALRPALLLSYRALPDAPRRLFRRFGLLPGHEFGTDLAAVLGAGDGAPELGRLVEAGLLQPAAVDDRYRLHDLLALFARERSTAL